MSRGSEAAMLTAIHSAIRVRGVVATVPGNVVAGSWPSGGPAWLLDGRPLPYVDHSGPDCEYADALIPVEYPQAGHSLGYLLPSLPPGLLPREITDEAADQAARADAWPKAVEFIRKLGSLK